MLASGDRTTYALRFCTALLFLILPSAISSDTSPPRQAPEHEWRDSQGRAIKRLDRFGKLTLFWWDDKDRLVKVAGMARLFTKATAAGPLEGSESWVHLLLYDEKASDVVTEVDCSGVPHRIASDSTRKVDTRAHTALKNHRHLRETGCEGKNAPQQEER